MRLAGLEISSDGVAELRDRLRDANHLVVSARLTQAIRNNFEDVALTIRERTLILDVLIDSTAQGDQAPELGLLRDTLLAEEAWFVRTGLTSRRIA
jgi:hypothetical protein